MQNYGIKENLDFLETSFILASYTKIANAKKKWKSCTMWFIGGAIPNCKYIFFQKKCINFFIFMHLYSWLECNCPLEMATNAC